MRPKWVKVGRRRQNFAVHFCRAPGKRDQALLLLLLQEATRASFGLSAVSVPGLVHGSGVVERLGDDLSPSDPAVFPEASEGHGQHRQ